MWLARNMKQQVPLTDAEQGISTIEGEELGVVTRGEVRRLPLYGPGGYIWRPESGAHVLVIKGGPGGEEQCVCGEKQGDAPENIQAGEVYLYAPGGNSVYLKKNGEIELRGRVSIRGTLIVNGEAYQPCTCGSGEEF